MWGTMQLIVIHDMTRWQHACWWQQIVAWGKSPWSRRSWNLRPRRSFSGVHQTHEVCQHLASSYALGCLMHRAHGTLWIVIRTESQTCRVHANTNASVASARNTSHYVLFESPYHRQNHRGGNNTKHGLWLKATVLRGHGRGEGTRLIFHLFMRHACWCALCTCRILSFIIAAVKQRAVSPLIHIMGNGASSQTQLQISHERETVLFLLLTRRKEALLGQLSCRNMAWHQCRVCLCWPAAIWIPPRLVSYCKNLPLLWVCPCFSKKQPES